MINYKYNIYHILGLPVSAGSRDVVKRSKEIINRLKIGDIPEYDADIKIYDEFRTEESVRDAVQKFQTPHKKIKEYFFWFSNCCEVDNQALSLVRSGSYIDALKLWENCSRDTCMHLKNRAILCTMLLFLEDNQTFLDKSIMAWRDIINSEDFWVLFSKQYMLDDEQGANASIVERFRCEVLENLADIYTELHLRYNKLSYLNEFRSTFACGSKRMNSEVLSPLLEKL